MVMMVVVVVKLEEAVLANGRLCSFGLWVGWDGVGWARDCNRERDASREGARWRNRRRGGACAVWNGWFEVERGRSEDGETDEGRGEMVEKWTKQWVVVQLGWSSATQS